MGVPEFVSAARTLQAAEDAAAPAAATNTAAQTGPNTAQHTTGSKAQGKGAAAAAPNSVTPTGAVTKAPLSAAAAAAKARRSKRVLKGRAALSLLMSQASGLEVGELVGDGGEGDDVEDPVQHAHNLQAWSQLCSAAKQAADAQQQQQQQASTQQLTSSSPSVTPIAHKLQGRLRQLTVKLAGLLTASLAVDPTAAPISDTATASDTQPMPSSADAPSDTQQRPTHTPSQTQPTLSTPGAVTVDELAATAAAMSVELRGDVEKGCRLRKRKALADFLGELQELGLSKRQADVPPGGCWRVCL